MSILDIVLSEYLDKVYYNSIQKLCLFFCLFVHWASFHLNVKAQHFSSETIFFMAFFQVETKDYLIHSSVIGEHQTSPDICHLSTTWTPMLVIPMLQLSNSKINSISIFLLVDCFIPVLSGFLKKHHKPMTVASPFVLIFQVCKWDCVWAHLGGPLSAICTNPY